MRAFTLCWFLELLSEERPHSDCQIGGQGILHRKGLHLRPPVLHIQQMLCRSKRRQYQNSQMAVDGGRQRFIKEIPIPQSDISELTISSRKTFIAYSNCETIFILDYAKQELLLEVQTRDHVNKNLQFSQDEEKLAYFDIGDDGESTVIKVMHIRKRLDQVIVDVNYQFNFAFSLDSKEIFFRDGELQKMDLESETVVYKVSSKWDEVLHACQLDKWRILILRVRSLQVWPLKIPGLLAKPSRKLSSAALNQYRFHNNICSVMKINAHLVLVFPNRNNYRYASLYCTNRNKLVARLDSQSTHHRRIAAQNSIFAIIKGHLITVTKISSRRLKAEMNCQDRRPITSNIAIQGNTIAWAEQQGIAIWQI